MSQLKFVIFSLVLASFLYMYVEAKHYTIAQNKEWNDFKVNFTNFAYVLYLAFVATFRLFQAEYKRNYNDAEDKVHKEIYFKNKKMIEDHNKLFKAGKVDYELKINQFTDKVRINFIHSTRKCSCLLILSFVCLGRQLGTQGSNTGQKALIRVQRIISTS